MSRDRLLGAMAAALSTRAHLPALADVLAGAPASLDGVAAEDVRLCWSVHGLPPPASIASLPASTPPAPPDVASGWESLAAWAEAEISHAVPGDAATLVRGRHEDLLRGAALALVEARMVRAAGCLRWLALGPRDASWSDDFRAALTALLQAVHHAVPGDRLEAAMHAAAALAIARTTAGGGTPAPAIAAPAHPALDPATRTRLIARGADWLARNRDQFLLPPRAERHDELLALKALGELAFVSDLLAEEPPHAALAEELLALAWQRLESGRRLQAMIEALPATSVFATTYLVFHRRGFRSPELADALERHAAAVPPASAPLVADSLRRIGRAVPEVVADAARARSVLAAARAPWAMSRFDCYDVTHEVIAATDVGREPLGTGRSYVARWGEVWLREFEIIGDHDLLAEMILALHCAGGGCAPPSGWQVLVAAQREDGLVAFATNDLVARQSVGDYHSTLMTLAAALSCHHARPA